MRLALRSDMIGRPNKNTKFRRNPQFEGLFCGPIQIKDSIPLQHPNVQDFSTYLTRVLEAPSCSLLVWRALLHIVPRPLPDIYHCLVHERPSLTIPDLARFWEKDYFLKYLEPGLLHEAY